MVKFLRVALGGAILCATAMMHTKVCILSYVYQTLPTGLDNMHYGITSSIYEYDRSSKFAHYRSIPGLQDYLLIDPEAVAVEHFHRLKRDEWLLRVYSQLDDVLVLDTLGISLALGEFYDLAEG